MISVFSDRIDILSRRILPPAQTMEAFTFRENLIVVTIPLHRIEKVGNKNGLNVRRQRIITEMRDKPNITTSELHQILGISETAVENNLTFLKENGYVERVGSKKTGYWKVLE